MIGVVSIIINSSVVVIRIIIVVVVDAADGFVDSPKHVYELVNIRTAIDTETAAVVIVGVVVVVVWKSSSSSSSSTVSIINITIITTDVLLKSMCVIWI